MKIAVTKAQSILLRMGVPYELVTLGHRKGRLPSFTKKGPGRKSAHTKR